MEKVCCIATSTGTRTWCLELTRSDVRPCAKRHAIPQFINRVINQWKVKTSANNDRVVFRYFADCVTGRANTIWITVVNELAKDDASRTFESWQKCINFYIEKMQNMSYLHWRHNM